MLLALFSVHCLCLGSDCPLGLFTDKIARPFQLSCEEYCFMTFSGYVGVKLVLIEGEGQGNVL